MEKKIRGYYKKYYLGYSIVFLLIAGIIYYAFYKYNKSFVYALYGDGHICFNSLVYYGKWLREIIMTLVQEHKLVIPVWDLSVGYGADIITTFSWMTLGDPLNLLSVFFSADNTEYLYGFLAVFRIYLAGITFSIYGLYHKNKRIPMLCGSIIYAFCGFALFAGVRDVYFMSPMIYFPLLLLGVDKLFKKERPYIFIFFTALAAITNFYYFFMLSIWIFIYGVYRYFMMFGKAGLRLSEIGKWLFKCICYYITGTAIAAFLLLPIAMQLLSSERFANHDYVPVLYSLDYYWKLLIRFTTSESMEAWTHLGYAPICVIAVAVLYLKKDIKYLPYKISFLMCIIFLMIPAAGSMMNAGSYVVNRWVWAFSMLVAYIFVKIYPELYTLNKKEKMALIFICAGYAILCLLRSEYRTSQMATMQVILLISVLAVLSGDYLENRKHIWQMLITGCVFLGIAANGIFRYEWFGSNYVSGFVEEGKPWRLIHDDLPSREICKMPDAERVRYDSLGDLEPMYNTAMNHGLNGTNFYFSLADGNITRYFDDLGVNVEMEHRYKGVDGRTILERLAGVKYCIAGKDAQAFVPYGYEKEIAVTDDYTMYVNENTLPLGYTYDTYMTYEDYNNLSFLQRQQALLQCAIVEESQLTEAAPVFNEQELEFALESQEGIEILKDKIIVTDTRATLKLEIKQRGNSEIYLVLSGLIYENNNDTDMQQTSVSFCRGESKKEMILYAPEHAFYHGRNDYLLNLGYVKDAGNLYIEIKFSQPGIYYVDDLKAMGQPMDFIDQQTEMLKKDALENIQISTNEIRGSIALKENKILCLAIPYSKGWSAYANGQKLELQRINDVFLGTELLQGDYEIIFTYRTPYLKEGFIITCLGLLGFTGIFVWEKGKMKKNRGEGK